MKKIQRNKRGNNYKNIRKLKYQEYNRGAYPPITVKEDLTV
jgi:hypothetical protein